MFLSDESRALAVERIQSLVDTSIAFGGNYIDKVVDIIMPIKQLLNTLGLDDMYDAIIDSSGKPKIKLISEILKDEADAIEDKKNADMKARVDKALSKFDTTCSVCHSGVAKACGYDFSTGLPKFLICPECGTKLKFVKDDSRLGYHTEYIEVHRPTE